MKRVATYVMGTDTKDSKRISAFVTIRNSRKGLCQSINDISILRVKEGSMVE